MKLLKSRKRLLLYQLVIIMFWLTNLCRTDSYFSIYALTAASSLYCLSENGEKPFPGSRRALAGGLLFTFFLSLAPVLSNLPLFEMAREITDLSDQMNHLMGILEGILTVFAGIPIFYQILKYFAIRCSRPVQQPSYKTDHPGIVFLLTFGLILTIDLTYLFVVAYPGNLSHDTMGQLGQIQSGVFNNFAPFWHTQLIRLLMGIGYKCFGTANAAAATFCVFQIFLVAAVFSYAIMTLYESRVPRYWFAISFCMYVFLPYNIVFSVSIWKDVPYGAAMLLVAAAAYRLLRNVGKTRKLDLVLLTLGGILSCMARTNGVYVMAATFLILLLVMGRNIRTVLIPWVIVVILGGIMNGPVLSTLNIQHIRPTEMLALPMQQVARVIWEDGEISQEDMEMIQQVADVEKVKEAYWNITVDPVKNIVWNQNIEYLLEHKLEYTALWLRLGVQNPAIYMRAWADLTKGYWNGGYDYYFFAEYIADNSFGLHRQYHDGLLWKLSRYYFALTRETILFEPLLSIGLMVWLTFLGFYLCILRKKKEGVLYIPLLIITVCLWIGAPVYSEFRYVYPLFTCFPLLFPVTLHCAEMVRSPEKIEESV